MAGQATLCAAWLGFSSRPTPSPPRRRKIVCPPPPRNEEGRRFAEKAKFEENKGGGRGLMW